MRDPRDARPPGPGLGLALLAALAVAGCGRASAEPDPVKAEATADPGGGALLGPRVSALAPQGEGWNAAQIDWQSYDAGLARARAERKPILLVFYTGWCPHCKNYSRVFDDPRVVERARDFVMIRANADEQSDLAQKFTTDGGYVPRTYFLSPDGVLARDIHAPRPKFQYFYDENNPAGLLAGMETARKLAVN
jgi:thiol:disulfide interchange protein